MGCSGRSLEMERECRDTIFLFRMHVSVGKIDVPGMVVMVVALWAEVFGTPSQSDYSFKCRTDDTILTMLRAR